MVWVLPMKILIFTQVYILPVFHVEAWLYSRALKDTFTQ